MSDIVFHGRAIRPAEAASGTLRRVMTLSSSAIGVACLMLARSRERRVLASLDARGLRDIGLTRGQVEIEIRKWFWQD
jgi:uncharacterized protein YjiS (DUF1127 family)